MASQRVVILIIAHKQHLEDREKASLAQCYRILGKYRIVLICPEGLNVKEYTDLNPEAEFLFIPPKWQATYAMFNRLKIEPFLYRKFIEYDYVLFYELDAWVFRDELEYWMDKDYDLIGAPWFKGYHRAVPGDPAIGIGNGGFSLRKVSSLLRALNSFSRIHPVGKLWSDYRRKRNWKYFARFLRGLTIGNNTHHWFNDYEMNEDHFWYHAVAKKFDWFKIPDAETALNFAVETNPSWHIKRMGRLPFGCHAWHRFEPEFWRQYISVTPESMNLNRETGKV